MALPAGPSTFQSVTLGKYLIYKDEQHGPLHDVLQCSGTDSESPDATFQVVVDSKDPSLVNIKSSNGNYWRRADDKNTWIVSDAVAIHEDHDSWDSTLFRPVKVDDDPENNRYRFQHVQLGNYIQPHTDTYSFDAHDLLNAFQGATNDD
ncbi:unnamed protein product, partial [Prunus brigantina]